MFRDFCLRKRAAGWSRSLRLKTLGRKVRPLREEPFTFFFWSLNVSVYGVRMRYHSGWRQEALNSSTKGSRGFRTVLSFAPSLRRIGLPLLKTGQSSFHVTIVRNVSRPRGDEPLMSLRAMNEAYHSPVGVSTMSACPVDWTVWFLNPKAPLYMRGLFGQGCHGPSGDDDRAIDARWSSSVPPSRRHVSSNNGSRWIQRTFGNE